MGRTFEHQYKDSLAVAVSVIEHNCVEAFEGQTYEEDGGRVTVLEIERRVKAMAADRVKDVSNQKRKYMADLFSNIPALRVSSGRVGRPEGRGKSIEDREREKLEFEQQIEGVLMELFDLLGDVPPKIRVAEKLNMGCSNSPGGNNTRLMTFNSKLERLGVDYAAIVERVKLSRLSK